MTYVFTMIALLAMLVVPAKQAAAAACDGIASKIAAAKTATDHQAIAACYDEMAKQARAKAEEHTQMAASYRKTPDGVARGFKSLPDHCLSLAKQYGEEAAMYDEMAKAHRDAAK
jgi:hypothetical protein